LVCGNLSLNLCALSVLVVNAFLLSAYYKPTHLFISLNTNAILFSIQKITFVRNEL
jgi:hypothetical protein